MLANIKQPAKEAFPVRRCFTIFVTGGWKFLSPIISYRFGLGQADFIFSTLTKSQTNTQGQINTTAATSSHFPHSLREILEQKTRGTEQPPCFNISIVNLLCTICLSSAHMFSFRHP